MNLRSIAYVVVALLLGWLGTGGDVFAQDAPDDEWCTASPNLNPQPPYPRGSCSREQAYRACMHWEGGGGAIRCPLIGSNSYERKRVSTGSWVGAYKKYFTHTCPEGQEWDDETNSCGNPCTGKPPLLNVHAEGDSHEVCSDGCAYKCDGSSVLFTIDGVLRTVCASSAWTVTGATCSAGELPVPIPAVTDSDGDGTSDDNDLSPNNPGESGDGSGQDVSRACGGPGQPECAPDGSNEGSGRGNTSGGGGDCNTPPRSSGDAILAQIAFQTWATRCAVIATANQAPGPGSGTGEGSEMDKLRDEVAGLDTSLGEGDADAAWIEGPTALDLDTGGLGIGGTCPAPPTVNGVSIDPDGNLCMLVQIIGTLVLVGAFAHAGYIIGRA